jgi:hypothetical protein
MHRWGHKRSLELGASFRTLGSPSSQSRLTDCLRCRTFDAAPLQPHLNGANEASHRAKLLPPRLASQG